MSILTIMKSLYYTFECLLLPAMDSTIWMNLAYLSHVSKLHQNTNVVTHESLNCYEIIIVLYDIFECLLRLT